MRDLTDITFVLDRSGSMDLIKSDTIGGFNAFLEEQRKAEGRARMSLLQFNHEMQWLYRGLDILEAPSLTDQTYQPYYSTSLFDAICTAIDDTGRRLADTPEEQRPNKVVVVILTDGLENASKEFTANDVKRKISHQQKVYNWQFLFLGANQDAIEVAQRMHISAKNTMAFAANSMGTQSVYHTAARSVRRFRSGATGQCVVGEEDYLAQANAGLDQTLVDKGLDAVRGGEEKTAE